MEAAGVRRAKPSKDMKTAALAVRFVTIVVSIAGIDSTDRMMALRRSDYTPSGLYVISAVRAGMGLVLIMAAANSRWHRTLSALGAAI